MTSKESFRERQENEFEVLQSIFGCDVEDLRQKCANPWKPLDIKIALTPLKGSSGMQQAYATTKLHIVCPSKYPKFVPKISIEDSKGLSDVLIDELTKELDRQANELKGEVMIFELAQTVQAFLHKHNKPPTGSFYDEMLLQKLKRDEDLRNMAMVKENQKRQELRDEVLKRAEIFRNEAKIRKDTRRSVSESSPTHRTPSSSDSSDGTAQPYFRSHMYPNECTEHRKSDALYFSNVGRKIQKGCCLGHSQKGCVAYSGIDLETGQLLYITEWNIKYTKVESVCFWNCTRNNETGKCGGHSVDDVIANIEKQVLSLSQLRHKNLITYECVLCMKKKDGIVVYLVQDFVLGTSVCSISGRLGWCAEGASMVARGVLDALIFLHNKGVSHSLLYDTTVFMDNGGTIRVTDFALVPMLQEMIGGQKFTKGDIPALGALVESLSPTPPSEMRDFIAKCKSERTLSASDLLDHPFLRPVLLMDRGENNTQAISEIRPVTTHMTHPNTPVTVGKSRLQTEFEVLQFLGKGAFGDVLKVRNILDNRQYAIKRIPLSSRNRQLYKKMTREVELLSRLNHENVVRYYNSWIESATISDEKSKINPEVGDWSISHESRIPSNHVPQMIDEDSSESDWLNRIPNAVGSSSSDGIQFVNSQGEVVVLDSDDDDDDDELTERNMDSAKPKPLLQYMYIQMEFCEKSTLRTAIDNNLYTDFDRLWRFFREIVEGLSHIHQQGMIHRDLKPVNIFIDSRDQVKIGDFGLATTSFLALQSQERNNEENHQNHEISDSLTGKVGTALYTAPELTDNASKSTYNQKVDLYSLGIILFEMSFPPINTGMERIQVLNALRSPSIIIPEMMFSDKAYQQNVLIIRWLLDHDPGKRPTAEELLTSELVPPAKLEANELQEMLRHALANPQSKSYKHLIARCLGQQCDAVLDHTYHMGLVPISSTMEYIKNKIVNLFRKHGAIEVVTPLLTPFSKGVNYHNSVRLMTHSGNVVFLPYDLRVPFVRHVAVNGINSIRRYSVGRVYREKKVFNFHPKQLYECAFDIITPNPGNLLVDAELLSVAYEVTYELPILRQKNISIRMNHTTLLRAILLYCNVPSNKYSDLFAALLDFMDGKISKFQLQTSVNGIMQITKQSTSILLDLLQTEYPLGGPRGSISGSNLRNLIKGRGEAASLAKGAIRELESVVTLAQGLGVSCPINLLAGLPIGYDRAKTGGIVWQMLAEDKASKQCKRYILAAGGRYDSILTEFQKSAQNSGFSIPEREISGVGFSFALDKLIFTLGSSITNEVSSVDVVVCVTGPRPPLKDVTQIVRSLWVAGIRTGIVEAINPDEAQDLAKELGPAHIVLLGEGGALRVRSWERDRFHERHVARPELIDSIQKLLRPESSIQNEISSAQSNIYSTNMTKILSSSLNLPTVHVILMTNERLTTNMRRRYETQLKQQMTNTLMLFEKKEKFTVVAVELPGPILGALTGALDPREFSSSQSDDHVNHVIEKYPKHKKYILEIYEELIDLFSERRNPSIIGLYSITDFCYRIIL